MAERNGKAAKAKAPGKSAAEKAADRQRAREEKEAAKEEGRRRAAQSEVDGNLAEAGRRVAEARGRFDPARRPLLALGLDLGMRSGMATAWFDPAELIGGVRISSRHLRSLVAELCVIKPVNEYETFATACARLRQTILSIHPDVIFVEQALYGNRPANGRSARSMASSAAQEGEFFGKLRASVFACAEKTAGDIGIPVFTLPIAEMKRRATGSGAAGKEDMVSAWNAFVGEPALEPAKCESTGHDDIADAGWALVLGLEKYGAGLVPAPSRPVFPDDLRGRAEGVLARVREAKGADPLLAEVEAVLACVVRANEPFGEADGRNHGNAREEAERGGRPRRGGPAGGGGVGTDLHDRAAAAGAGPRGCGESVYDDA